MTVWSLTDKTTRGPRQRRSALRPAGNQRRSATGRGVRVARPRAGGQRSHLLQLDVLSSFSPAGPGRPPADSPAQIDGGDRRRRPATGARTAVDGDDSLCEYAHGTHSPSPGRPRQHWRRRASLSAGPHDAAAAFVRPCGSPCAPVTLKPASAAAGRPNWFEDHQLPMG